MRFSQTKLHFCKINKCLANLFLLMHIGYAAVSQMAFQSYTMEQGLSQNSVYCITQSPDGLLWLGTNYGLNSFDGQNFVQFLPKNQAGKPLSGVIQALALYKNEYLLVGTNNEMLFFHLPTASFSPSEEVFSKLQLPEGASPRKFLIDKQGNIWILTLNHGLYFFQSKLNLLQNLSKQKKGFLNFTDITFDTNERLFASTENQLFEVKMASITQINLPYKSLNIKAILAIKDELFLANANEGILKINLKNENNVVKLQLPNIEADIVKLMKDSDGNLWAGTRTHGIRHINLRTNTSENDFAEKTNNSLKKNYVLCLFEDKAKNIWVGLSGGGLAKYLKNEPIFETIKYPTTGTFNDNMTFSITSADGENFYFGTLTGGLVAYNRSKKKFTYHQAKGLPIETRNIYDIEQQGNILWLATWAGLCSFDKQTGSFKLYSGNTKLFTIKVLNEQNLILVSGEYGLSCFDLQTKTWKPCHDPQGYLNKHNLVARHIEQLNNSEIGLSTLNRNFVKYNLQTGTFTEYSTFQALSLSSRHFFKNSNDLWIATDNGLLQVNAQTMQIIKFWTQQNGLANDFIYAILPDNLGGIWFTHNGGLSRLNISKSQITNFTLNDGLQDLEFNTASSHKTKQGHLLFGGINGVNYINVNNIKPKNYAIKPIITQVKVFNEPIKLAKAIGFVRELNLKTEENNLSIDFTAPNPRHSNMLQYRYRLVGLHAEWVEAGNRTYASFGHLAPGNYRFEVVSYDNQGHESSPKVLAVNIAVPIWQQKWFIISAIILVISAIIFGLRYRLKLIQNRHNKQLQLAELETKASQLQLNSHFIFNSLSLISELITSKSNKDANHFLIKFANVIRYKLGQSQNFLTTLATELAYIAEYIEIEKKRFDNTVNLSFNLEISQNINPEKMEIPTNVLQPLIEKTIWHNSYSDTSIRILCLKIFEKNDKICVQLNSNSTGYNFEKAEFDVVNIENIQKRLKLLNESLRQNFSLLFNEKLDEIKPKNKIFELELPSH